MHVMHPIPPVILDAALHNLDEGVTRHRERVYTEYEINCCITFLMQCQPRMAARYIYAANMVFPRMAMHIADRLAADTTAERRRVRTHIALNHPVAVTRGGVVCARPLAR